LTDEHDNRGGGGVVAGRHEIGESIRRAGQGYRI
jgi:hypothetical protein